MFIAIDCIPPHGHLIVSCTEDDGEVHEAIVAAPTEDEVRQAIAKVFGKDWAYGQGGYPPRYRAIEIKDFEKLAHDAGIKWRYGGGEHAESILHVVSR